MIGTLRLDKDVSFKRSKLIIKYTRSRCCWKDIFAASTSRSPTTPPTLTLFSSFLPEVEKRGRKSHLHQAKLCWAALSVEKTWGFDSSHSMVINYFSTVVGLLFSPFLSFPILLSSLLLSSPILLPSSPHLSSVCCDGGGGGGGAAWWLEATHDKCCPYYWSHWEKTQAAVGQRQPITALRGP